MTAEVAVMNKYAIALAADSTVTITGGHGEKTYDTVNKLFTLSKYHPVGVMIFGNAEFMGVPWETIIKVYRKELGNTFFDTVKQYGDHFIDFLENHERLFSKDLINKYQIDNIFSYLYVVKNDIDEQVREVVESDDDSKISIEQIKNIVKKQIGDHYDHWKKVKLLPTFSEDDLKAIITSNNDNFDEAISDIFQKLPLTVPQRKRLEYICACIFCKERFAGESGVVIAGFGEEEFFPVLYPYTIEGIVIGKLKYTIDEGAEIGVDESATIVAFAQKEMVRTFMHGLHPQLSKAIAGALDEMFRSYAQQISDIIPKLNENQKKAFRESIESVGDDVIQELFDNISRFQHRNFVDPTLRAVASLPKDELATLAESLVHITSTRRKFSLDAETVGGAIDVALITKGDGLIWIKRKHYFDPRLNYHFFQNYYPCANLTRREPFDG